MNEETICILGGYGDVGLRVARLLHARSDARILLAGRDGTKAARVARTIGERCEGMALDVKATEAATRLKGMTLCVSLTEATPPGLAAALVAEGTGFIDSSASPDYVTALRSAIEAVASPQASAILEAGLAPGLTNVMAAGLCRDHPETARIDVLIEMGMGVHHGFAATEWTLQSLGRTYPVKVDAKLQHIRTGALRRTFETDTGTVSAIGFAFCDQQGIARDNALDSARTYLAVDPGWMTRVLGWLSRPALASIIQHHAATLARSILRMPTMGGTGTHLVVEAYDVQGNLLGRKSLTGGPQADLTAEVLATAALGLIEATEDRIPGLLRLTDMPSVQEILIQQAG
ncbi:saccharopine dehydrogenase NADP-binding domain-containing protein [Salipiger mucosus]|uniref:Saccharopine dehydrogenase NADP binding domain-containing protein n=1 Tax=Salipiger mucosus DSM 16094 TaxID=1123237 RepID=S9S1M6_9RHOB|nr:saccharopine dehydrogenase NADP-binding domain-containing protein [Salipiger mucosus]EPX84100.1 hypothetical protein Salmuc_01875 [Salipiger mucosus DSM 16094]